MNLIRFNPHTPALGTPFEPFALMRDFMRMNPWREAGLTSGQEGFTPAFDIRENPEGYLFTADMPGVAREELSIDLTGNRLTIAGQRKAEARQESEKLYAAERVFGQFSRTFTLPDGVDAGAVKAELKDGVLSLTIPKVPEVKPRKISIQAS
nr:HSP20 family small heat-shock protein [uncultured Holophaga sp.]